jgi:hypothetical protein
VSSAAFGRTLQRLGEFGLPPDEGVDDVDERAVKQLRFAPGAIAIVDRAPCSG